MRPGTRILPCMALATLLAAQARWSIAGTPPGFFSQPLEAQAAALMQSVGCLRPDYDGDKSSGEIHSCRRVPGNGMHATLRVMLFGPHPASTGPIAYPAEDNHVYVEWMDFQPGSVPSTHDGRADAARMVDDVLEVTGFVSKEPIQRTFFSSVPRDGDRKMTFRSGGLVARVVVDDNNGLTARLLFVQVQGKR